MVEEVAGEIGRALETLQPVIKIADEANDILDSVSSPKKGGGSSRSSIPDLGISQSLWQFLTWLADASERLAGVTFRSVMWI